jgi:hypothetical protein
MSKMSKWIVFYDSKGKELAAYTEAGTFAGERKATADLLAFERGIPDLASADGADIRILSREDGRGACAGGADAV